MGHKQDDRKIYLSNLDAFEHTNQHHVKDPLKETGSRGSWFPITASTPTLSLPFLLCLHAVHAGSPLLLQLSFSLNNLMRSSQHKLIL